MTMTNVIFGFERKEIRISMEEKRAKELFHHVTGVTIIDNDKDKYKDSKIEEKVRHPSI